jgi:hypothetical protein
MRHSLCLLDCQQFRARRALVHTPPKSAFAVVAGWLCSMADRLLVGSA